MLYPHAWILIHYQQYYSLKDGAPLAEDARVVVNRDGGPNGSYEITVKKVQAGDAGTYSAVASNNFGKAECAAKVGVKGNHIMKILSHIRNIFPIVSVYYPILLFITCLFSNRRQRCLRIAQESWKPGPQPRPRGRTNLYLVQVWTRIWSRRSFQGSF